VLRANRIEIPYADSECRTVQLRSLLTSRSISGGRKRGHTPNSMMSFALPPPRQVQPVLSEVSDVCDCTLHTRTASLEPRLTLLPPVANAAPDPSPNSALAVAIASSKKLLVPISAGRGTLSRGQVQSRQVSIKLAIFGHRGTTDRP
jgi:hypothetical protein